MQTARGRRRNRPMQFGFVSRILRRGNGQIWSLGRRYSWEQIMSRGVRERKNCIARSAIENIEQRIYQDLRSYPGLAASRLRKQERPRPSSGYSFQIKMPAGASSAGTCSYYFYSYCTGALNNLNPFAAPKPAAAPQRSTDRFLQTCCRTRATAARWFRHRSGAGWAVRSGGLCARRYLRR